MNPDYQDVTLVTLDKRRILWKIITNILLIPVCLFLGWLGLNSPPPNSMVTNSDHIIGFLLFMGSFGTYITIRIIWSAILDYFDSTKGLFFCSAGLIYRMAEEPEGIIKWSDITGVRFVYHEKNPLLAVHVLNKEFVIELLHQQGENPDVNDILYGSPMVIDTHRLDMSSFQVEETFKRYVEKYGNKQIINSINKIERYLDDQN